jgi:thioredoxin-dependent peroxiredoxin
MLQENDLAPDFELSADDGSTVKLSELRGRRVILFFYPKADTPGCTTEACEFGELMPQIKDREAVVFGISPDPVEKVRRFREKFDLPYRLLADEDHSVAEAYGVWKEKSMYGKKYMGVERSTFLIDEQGRVAKAFLKVSPKGHAAEVVGTL